jgi:predicted dehydrogenase
MGDSANGANFFTIAGGHVIDALEFCVAPFSHLDGAVATHFPEWRLTDTGGAVTVDAPDSVVAHGALEGGATASIHAASVPHNASGWVMRIHGTEGTIVASTPGLPQITPIELLGSRAGKSLETLPLPPSLDDQMPAGPAGNVGRAYQHLAEAITQGTAFTPDFSHATRLHGLTGSMDREHG